MTLTSSPFGHRLGERKIVNFLLGFQVAPGCKNLNKGVEETRKVCTAAGHPRHQQQRLISPSSDNASEVSENANVTGWLTQNGTNSAAFLSPLSRHQFFREKKLTTLRGRSDSPDSMTPRTPPSTSKNAKSAPKKKAPPPVNQVFCVVVVFPTDTENVAPSPLPSRV